MDLKTGDLVKILSSGEVGEIRLLNYHVAVVDLINLPKEKLPKGMFYKSRIIRNSNLKKETI